MPSSEPGRESNWRVEVVPKDETGKQVVLEKYKPWRLTALRLDPGSFSSTLAREESFDDQVWTSRLMDPDNTVVVAIESSTQDIICAAFLRELSSAEPSDVEAPESSSSMLFGIFGVWTLPRARRQGVALAVLEKVKSLAKDIVKTRDRGCHVEVEAYKDNSDAIRLYTKAGFVASASPEGEFVKLILSLSTS